MAEQDENLAEKMKGISKETVGKVTGDEEKQKEGEAQQEKAQKAEEAERLEAEARQKRNEEAGKKGEQTKRS